MQKTEYEGERQHLQEVTILGTGVSGLVLGWMLGQEWLACANIRKRSALGRYGSKKGAYLYVSDNMHYSKDIMIFMPVY
jgi:ribulose 1,5-bisphosphate synthetase/thiazole synthase